MTAYYVYSGASTDRANNTAYTLGQKVCLARTDTQSTYQIMRGVVYECTTAGTSGSTPPVWNYSAGATTTDGTVVWTARAADSWANALRYLDYIPITHSSGDTFYVASDHSEAGTNVSYAVTFNGTPGSPCYLYCVDRGTMLPAVMSGLINYDTASTININGSVVGYGIKFKCASGNNNQIFNFAAASNIQSQFWENCNFLNGSTSTSPAGFRVGSSSANSNRTVKWKNCNISFGAGGNQRLFVNQAYFEWDGGGLVPGSASPLAIVSVSAVPNYAEAILKNVDFSSATVGICIFDGSASIGKGACVNCAVPASWTGSLASGSPGLGPRFEAFNTRQGTSRIKYMTSEYQGSIRTDSAYVKTGGSSYSQKMASASVASLATVLRGLESEDENTGTSPITITLSVLHDSTTPLNDDEFWFDVRCNDVTATSRKPYLSNGPSALPSSSDIWATAGMTNPMVQKASVTFTPAEAGEIIVTPYLAKPNKTVFADLAFVRS